MPISNVEEGGLLTHLLRDLKPRAEEQTRVYLFPFLWEVS
jgi:hypothetical protein